MRPMCFSDRQESSSLAGFSAGYRCWKSFRQLKAYLATLLAHSERGRIANLKKYLEIDEHEFTKCYFKIDYRDPGNINYAARPTWSFRPHRDSVERFYDPQENAIERFQRFDLYTFNQTHTQVFDRLGAPYGICVTSPFLAPEIIDVVETLPSRLKADGLIAKPVLKTLATRFFPEEWIYREHQGFPTPTSRWLKGPLSSWRLALSDEQAGLPRCNRCRGNAGWGHRPQLRSNLDGDDAGVVLQAIHRWGGKSRLQ